MRADARRAPHPTLPPQGGRVFDRRRPESIPLGLSTLTFASGRTNALLGAVHLLLFFAYLMLIFER